MTKKIAIKDLLERSGLFKKVPNIINITLGSEKEVIKLEYNRGIVTVRGAQKNYMDTMIDVQNLFGFTRSADYICERGEGIIEMGWFDTVQDLSNGEKKLMLEEKKGNLSIVFIRS